jgi:hypothetical protein
MERAFVMFASDAPTKAQGPLVRRSAERGGGRPRPKPYFTSLIWNVGLGAYRDLVSAAAFSSGVIVTL